MDLNTDDLSPDFYLTQSLEFSAFLLIQGFQLSDTTLDPNGQVVFKFNAIKDDRKVDIQRIYERFLIGDEFKISPHKFCQGWRQLRKVVDLVIRRANGR